MIKMKSDLQPEFNNSWIVVANRKIMLDNFRRGKSQRKSVTGGPKHFCHLRGSNQ